MRIALLVVVVLLAIVVRRTRDEPEAEAAAPRKPVHIVDTRAVAWSSSSSQPPKPRLAPIEQPVVARSAHTIYGIVRDDRGEPLGGVTVIVAQDGREQVVITDEAGAYALVELPRGSHTVKFYYLDHKVEIPDVEVGDVAATVLEPIIDADDRDYTRDIPAGRTFDDVVGAAAGSQVDSYGISISDETTVENEYVVDDDGWSTISSLQTP